MDEPPPPSDQAPAAQASAQAGFGVASPLPAVAFLTRIPVPGQRTPALGDIARAQVWFPAVGLVIGVLLLAVDRIANRALPDPSVDVIIVVALIAVTGALHLDGLADAADGLFGGYNREGRLAIMHDVHAGTYAIVALISILSLKWSGLIATPSSVRVEALLLVPCLARFSMVLAIGIFPYARPEGMGANFRGHAWPVGVIVGGTTAVVAGVVLLGAGGILATVFASACGVAFGLLCLRLVGGMTGDLYGATVEVSEAATFLFIAALANRGWLGAWVLA